MDVYLVPDDKRSLVLQIYDQLRDAIADGRLEPGFRLTPTRTLARELGVARSTVADAYGRLVAEGYADGRRGGGTTVATVGATSVPEPADAAGLRATERAEAVDRYGTDLTARARYDLTAGRIDAGLFPHEDWRPCVRAAVSDPRSVGTYGEPAGTPALREALARWITQSRGIAAWPDQIVATQGATQAIDLLARALLVPGDIAAVEEPGYPPVVAILQSQGIEVVGVPVDRDGLIVDALPERARLVHVTPSHQYPLGGVLSRERRLTLLDWASSSDAVIVEDDYDSEFRYGRRPLEPLHRLDHRGRVVYVGTFSKILSPSLRMGFAVAPRPLVPTLVALRQALDFGPPALLDLALTTFIADGYLARHLRRARKAYGERHAVLWQELDDRLPDGMTPLATNAGLHLTLLAPDAPPDDELVDRARERDLMVSTLRRTYSFSEGQAGVVLGFGAIATEDIAAAGPRLIECLRP
jgi:GntR family transcriptional regulator/MocR family aminotransferase